jgi:Tripartite tricarboxylate transporter family receptor
LLRGRIQADCKPKSKSLCGFSRLNLRMANRNATHASTRAVSFGNLRPLRIGEEIAVKRARSAVGRRGVLAGLAGALATPTILQAENNYPRRTVRYINPFPAGGATDTLSRLFCAKMSELTGQQWIVDNTGGSGGNVGMDALAQLAPDGYTLGLGGVATSPMRWRSGGQARCGRWAPRPCPASTSIRGRR